jgi:hypothetical protein|nr:MAG TPA: Pplase1 alpha-glutamyl/putrescinyl thymine pyrophosphorylase clade 1 [Caudoviricetes sp.]
MIIVKNLYEHYVKERWLVYARRSVGLPAPWTRDPVIAGSKFTNDFRILDAGSQFLLGDLCSDGAPLKDLMMRCFLYRYTNRREPWNAFKKIYGRFPVIEDLESGKLMDFLKGYDSPIFGPAYRVHVGSENTGIDKVSYFVGLAAQAFTPTGGKLSYGHGWGECGELYILPQLESRWGDAEGIFNILRTLPRCSDFMSQQVLTDYTYLPQSTMTDSDHVVPGPGSKRGMDLLESGKSYQYILKEYQDYWSSKGPVLTSGHVVGHTLSLMDVQNTFCEFQKYVRRLNSGRKFTPYSPSNPDRTWSDPVLPKNW